MEGFLFVNGDIHDKFLSTAILHVERYGFSRSRPMRSSSANKSRFPGGVVVQLTQAAPVDGSVSAGEASDKVSHP